jgi:hypothetical protein
MRGITRLKQPQAVDLDDEDMGGSLGEDLRRTALGDMPRHQDHVEYAPPQTRIEDAMLEGKEELKLKIDDIISKVNEAVQREIKAMRVELDDLENVAQKSCDAVKLSLENQLNIAAHALASCNRMRGQIAEFTQVVHNNLPRVESPKREEESDEG